MALKKVQQMLSDQLGVDIDRVEENSLIVEDLGADSLDVVELLMLLEDEFGIELSEEEAVALKSVSDIVTLIESIE